jgi:hypothetical protein
LPPSWQGLPISTPSTTVEPNIKKAHECEVGAAAFADVVLNTDKYKQLVKELSPMEMPATKKQIVEPALAFKAYGETKVDLVKFLRANRDIFAWQPSDMHGVPREFAEHSLNVYPDAKPVEQTIPVKQTIRCFGPEGRRAIGKEIARLQIASFIR